MFGSKSVVKGLVVASLALSAIALQTAAHADSGTGAINEKRSSEANGSSANGAKGSRKEYADLPSEWHREFEQHYAARAAVEARAKEVAGTVFASPAEETAAWDEVNRQRTTLDAHRSALDKKGTDYRRSRLESKGAFKTRAGATARLENPHQAEQNAAAARRVAERTPERNANIKAIAAKKAAEAKAYKEQPPMNAEHAWQIQQFRQRLAARSGGVGGTAPSHNEASHAVRDAHASYRPQQGLGGNGRR